MRDFLKNLFGQTGFFDAEMFKKGWWMLLLIIGTIAVLFAICCILVFSYSKG